jgi:hypothetical protein
MPGVTHQSQKRSVTGGERHLHDGPHNSAHTQRYEGHKPDGASFRIFQERSTTLARARGRRGLADGFPNANHLISF